MSAVQQSTARFAEPGNVNTVIPFNKFLDLFNGVPIDDETALARIYDRTASNSLPKPDSVVASVYRAQKYCRKDDNGRISFYTAGTLFVMLNDGTVKCWIRASDVIEGIGYQVNYVEKTLKKFVSDQYVYWKDICNLLYVQRLATANVAMVGVTEAHKLRENTIFLTENGVLQLHQLSPKCRAFRNTVSNFLLYVREQLTYGGRHPREAAASAPAPAITDATAAERDRVKFDDPGFISCIRYEGLKK